jgi:hypothetical protein
MLSSQSHDPSRRETPLTGLLPTATVRTHDAAPPGEPSKYVETISGSPSMPPLR